MRFVVGATQTASMTTKNNSGISMYCLNETGARTGVLCRVGILSGTRRCLLEIEDFANEFCPDPFSSASCNWEMFPGCSASTSTVMATASTETALSKWSHETLVLASTSVSRVI